MTIIGVEGGIGSGKTLTLVNIGISDLFAGKTIYSNVKLKVPDKYKDKVIYLNKEILNDIFEKIKTGMFDMRNSTVLIQEAHNYIDSRTSMSKKNRTFSYWILQSRHTGAGSCDIVYDTQELGQIDIRLRRNTDFVLRPFILERVDNVPTKVGVTWHGKMGQRWVKFWEEYDSSKVVYMYDTHEIVEF